MLFFVLVEIDTVEAVFDDELVPVVVLDDFDDLLLLVGPDDGEDLADDHFDEGGVVLDELVFELVLVEGVMSGVVGL